MKIILCSVGKTHDAQMKSSIEEFTARLSRYYPASWQIIPVPKNAASLSISEQKKKEGEAILQFIRPDDFLVALDEYGKLMNSVELSNLIDTRAAGGTKQFVFLIGGAFGLDKSVLERAQLKWSLSPLTFPHQLVRLILAEQLYRACTISRNEKYHHQ